MRADGKKEYSYEVMQRTLHLIKMFEDVYHERPQYIKIPKWLFRELQIERKEIYHIATQLRDVPMLCGLQICPSAEAQTLDDIEVF